MPTQEQSIARNNMDKEMALAVSYEAIKNLQWTIQFAGPVYIQLRKKENTFLAIINSDVSEKRLTTITKELEEVIIQIDKVRKDLNGL